MSANNAPADATGVPLTIAAEKTVHVSRAVREGAYRERAWLISVLASCVCAWPVVVDESTVSGHAPGCPTELMVQRDERKRCCRAVAR